MGELFELEAGEDAADAPVVQLAGCAPHYFHRDCLRVALGHSLRCPVCLRPAGPQLGTQPAGTMRVQHEPGHIPGHHCSSMLVISYEFP